MSSASPFRRSEFPNSPVQPIQWLGATVIDAARFAGFWTAIVIPFALLALVVTGAAADQVPLFATLLGVNFASLRLGHQHNRE